MELIEAIKGRRSIREYKDTPIPRELIEDIIEAATWSCGIMEQASVVIMVWNAGEEGWGSEVHSVAAATQNMLLRAYDLGLGSLWIANVFYAQMAVTRHAGVPWKMVAAVAIGYTDTVGRVPPKKGVHEVAAFLE